METLTKFFAWVDAQPQGTLLKVDKVANLITLTVGDRSIEVDEQVLRVCPRPLSGNLLFDRRVHE